MEDNFNNRDFEQFVKQNADQYRMFPSEKVWKNIHLTLHSRRRWYGLGLIVLLLTAGIVTWVMLSPSVSNNESLAYKPATISQNPITGQKNTNPPVLIAASKSADNKTHFITTTDNLHKNLFISDPANSLTDNNDYEKNSVPPVLANTNEPVVISAPSVQLELQAKPPVAYNKQIIHDQPSGNIISEEVKNNNLLISENKKADLMTPDNNPVAEKRDVFPLSIESVVNSYKHHRTGKKLSWEIFLSPTISYRKLSENKAFINSTQVNNNINNNY